MEPPVYPPEDPEDMELSRIHSRFQEMISREFRAPLAMILLSSELLANYSDLWDRETKLKHIRRIQAAVRQITELLEQAADDALEDD